MGTITGTMNRKQYTGLNIKFWAAALVFVFAFVSAGGAFGAVQTYEDGRTRLVINTSNGRFSLYYMTDVDKQTFEPLFWDKDVKTSFLAVSINGSEYRMGDASGFKIYLRGTDTKPILAFESKFVAVSEEFSFIRTASSGVSNGIRIDVRIENWSDKSVMAGARLLIDTFLGEKGNPHFRTNLRPVESELKIYRNPEEQWWVSRNDRYGLMGSISVEGIDNPELVYFANWKRLYESKFIPDYVQGRSFNSLLFSLRDSAVAYYYEQKTLGRWESAMFTVLLAAEDTYGFDIKSYPASQVSPVSEVSVPAAEIARYPVSESESVPATGQVSPSAPASSGAGGVIQPQAVINPAVSDSGITTVPLYLKSTVINNQETVRFIRSDLTTLRALVSKIDDYIYYDTPVSEDELRKMEMTVELIKDHYDDIF